MESPSSQICVLIADKSLPACGSLKATAAKSPPASLGWYLACCSLPPSRCTVQAAMPCEVITLRTELHKLPTCAVSSPLYWLLKPRPPSLGSTSAQNTPPAPSCLSTSSGSRPLRSQHSARSATSSVTSAIPPARGS